MSEQPKIPLNADSFNALVDAWHKSMVAVVMVLPPGPRQGAITNVARLAAIAEQQGQVLQETLLIDLHRKLRKWDLDQPP